ncbi:MAG: hypothetical protein ACYCWW_08745 [Deltaproteobacteria bacterium]
MSPALRLSLGLLAVALVDWAGNVGPRSSTTCLDTTDPSDPTVQWVPSGGLAASCASGPGDASLLPLAVAFLLRRRRRSR